MSTRRIAYFANSDWYLYNFRAPLAHAARQAFDAEIHCLCPDGPYRPKLEEMGFLWSEVPLERQGTNPLREWSLQRHTRGILREIRPELLHNFTLKPVIWGTRAARAEGVPAIVNALTGMGSVFRGRSLKGTIIRPIVKTLLRRSLTGANQRAIFQNSDDLELATSDLGVPFDQVMLIRGSGVDTARFSPAKELPTPPVVLFVGRLLKDKGILDFCSAAGRLHADHSDIRFLIAGTPDLGNPSSIQDLDVARISKAQPYLEFLGHVEDMLELYKGATILVLPSAYGEGVPRSLIEAAACGLPLIATDHPGCREIVHHGKNGWLVPVSDAAALAAAIKRLASSRTDQTAFGAQSRILAFSEFSEHLVFQHTFEVYRGLGLR